MGYNDLAEFSYARGCLVDALKNYVRTRDYSSTSKTVVSTLLSAVLVCIEMGQFSNVRNYVYKALQQNQDALDPVTIAKLQCATGLAHLGSKDYKLAARKVCLLNFLLLMCIPISVNIFKIHQKDLCQSM